MNEREQASHNRPVEDEMRSEPQLVTEQDEEPSTGLSRITWRDEATSATYAERVHGLNRRGHLVDRYRVAADAPGSLIPRAFKRSERPDAETEAQPNTEQAPTLQRTEVEIPPSRDPWNRRCSDHCRSFNRKARTKD